MRTETGLAPIALVVLAVALLSAMDAGMKVQTQYLPLMQAVWLRYATASLILIPVFLARPQRLTLRTLRANAVRGAIVAATALSFFYAISVLPLALVVAIAFVAPFFIALLGALLLGEPIEPRVAIGIGVGFLGILVILGGELRIGLTAEQMLGFLAAVAGAFGYALVAVMIRQQSSSDRATTMVLLQTVTAGLILTAPAAVVWAPLDGATLALGVGIGFLGAFGQLAIAAGFARAPAAKLGVIEYTSFIWATLFGLILFAEVPKLETVAGAAIIVAACLTALRPAKVPLTGRATARAPRPGEPGGSG
ncbi:DMT family transporter [Amorphus orientalis]|uniref:S-adenosylmethionine uptake transporter n=1 Tax=Amorphus orientalis TaxID=649198 RepID=A0AAE3VNK0_9HYPH|nr:DMT family transporter [Amorphus orientalis]MDQ0315260.1 S-adenosylmethionine uptake transporter [Amorphus orientalis]